MTNEEGGGVKAILPFLGDAQGFTVFAPPFIKRDDVLLSQTANICMFLAKKYGLVPLDETKLFQANQLALIVMDLVAEVFT